MDTIHTQESLMSLMIVVTLSFLIPIILERIRWYSVPVVVVEISAGIIIGKSGFGWIQDDVWLHLLSTLGFMFLMFISGLEINFELFRVEKSQGETNPLKIATLTFLCILIVSSVLGLAFQWLGFVNDWIFMTLLISTVSLSIVVPTLKDRGITNSLYGQTILLTAVLSDFVTMILLSVYVAMHAHDSTKPFLLLILFVVVFFMYRFMVHFEPQQWIRKISKESVQLGTRGVFALILFLVVLSESVGSESILGAFLAGVLISLISPEKEFVDRLVSFGFGFFIPIFFFMVGAKLDVPGMFHNRGVLFFVPLIVVALYLSKVIPTMLWRKWFSRRQTLAAGMLLPSTLSLIVAGTAIGIDLKIITLPIQAMLILSAVISCIISPILFHKVVPEEIEQSTKKIALIGENVVTLSLARNLHESGYEVTIFSRQVSQYIQNRKYPFHIEQVAAFTPDQFAIHQLQTYNSMIAFTSNEAVNITAANWAKQQGVETVICRLDNEEKSVELLEGIRGFSTYRSSRVLLQTLIEYPSMMKFLEADHPVQEVKISNTNLHNKRIRDLEFLGETLVIRIYRKDEVVIPHGHTQVKAGDILLVSGDQDSVQMVRKKCSR